MAKLPHLRLPPTREAADRWKGGGNAYAGGARPTRRQQLVRLGPLFRRLRRALQDPGRLAALRADPLGIAPEKTLVFELSQPVDRFAKAAAKAGFDVLAELDEDLEPAFGFDPAEGRTAVGGRLYCVFANEQALRELSSLYAKHLRGEPLGRGFTAFRDMFDCLYELRPWGPKDRLPQDTIDFLEARLDAGAARVRLEIELWRAGVAEDLKARIAASGGRLVASASIQLTGFHYAALLVELAADAARELIADLDSDLLKAPEVLLVLPTFEPQIAEFGEPVALESRGTLDRPTRPPRVVLLDGVPSAAHPDVDGFVVVDDPMDLGARTPVEARRHGTAMASIIAQGDLYAPEGPLTSPIYHRPILGLFDEPNREKSDPDRLFVDVVHLALMRAFLGEGATPPQAPEAVLVNFSIGDAARPYANRLSGLARLLDWWASTHGVLFIVSAGNVLAPVHLPDMDLAAFEALPPEEKWRRIDDARRALAAERTLLSPSEAVNVVTVGAAYGDSGDRPLAGALLFDAAPAADGPNLSSAVGLGHGKSLKPEILATGGREPLRYVADGGGIRLEPVVRHAHAGVLAASPTSSVLGAQRYPVTGTSPAAAMTSRIGVQILDALTDVEGPFPEGLGRRDAALLIKALLVHASDWGDSGRAVEERLIETYGGRRHEAARRSVIRTHGFGLVSPERAVASAEHSVCLLGLGDAPPDGAVIIDVPIPTALNGLAIWRRLTVTLAWMSPVSTRGRHYRMAKLKADPVGIDDWSLGVQGGPGAPEPQQVERGTVWKRALNGDYAVPIGDDAVLPLRISSLDRTKSELDRLGDTRFAVAVSFDVDQAVGVNIYQSVRIRPRPAVHA